MTEARESSIPGVPEWRRLEIKRPNASRLVPLEDVITALAAAYHPQNPLSMHPADFITKRFKAPGHEGLEER